MAKFRSAPRVQETTATTGTGTYSLAGAATGAQSFVAGIGDGNTCAYVATDGTDWEEGIGTVTDASPDTLSRDVVLNSSNSGSAVDWGSGNKDVFVSHPAVIRHPHAAIDNSDSPYTVELPDRGLDCDATSGAITVNLPAVAESKGRLLDIAKIDSSANAVTIDADGSEEINGATTLVLSDQYDAATLLCIGSEWIRLGGGGSGVSDHGALAGLTDDDHTQYLLADGTRGLSADWDAGSHKITAEQLESDVAGGTAPLLVASTTLVDNLNADLLDGVEGDDYALADGTRWTDTQTADRAVETDGSGNLVVSDITSTELGYLDGVTSNIQTQLDAKSSGQGILAVRCTVVIKQPLV